MIRSSATLPRPQADSIGTAVPINDKIVTSASRLGSKQGEKLTETMPSVAGSISAPLMDSVTCSPASASQKGSPHPQSAMGPATAFTTPTPSQPPSEWASAKYGGSGKRAWKKLHIGVDRSGVIVAQAFEGSNFKLHGRRRL